MIKHLNQRVAVLVDVSNMYHSAKNLYKRHVNFKEVLSASVAGRQLIRAKAYAVSSETNDDETPFFEALIQQGFEVAVKDLQVFPGGARKADWDVGIAMDAIRLGNKVDVIVIVSGDGDYLPLVEYLQNTSGCLVEVAAFKRTTSAKLIEAADDFIDLGDNKKYLLK
ncbi:MAG: NYN domain-containing protein [Patescibacteria group bacterium]|nr:NYN domain-containing protein [Patescibacteria group bacterium]